MAAAAVRSGIAVCGTKDGKPHLLDRFRNPFANDEVWCGEHETLVEWPEAWLADLRLWRDGPR